MPGEHDGDLPLNPGNIVLNPGIVRDFKHIRNERAVDFPPGLKGPVTRVSPVKALPAYIERTVNKPQTIIHNIDPRSLSI